MKHEDLKQKITNLVDEYITENGDFVKMEIIIHNTCNKGLKRKIKTDSEIDIYIEL